MRGKLARRRARCDGGFQGPGDGLSHAHGGPRPCPGRVADVQLMPLTVPGWRMPRGYIFAKLTPCLVLGQAGTALKGMRAPKFVVLCDGGGSPREPAVGGCRWELAPGGLAVLHHGGPSGPRRSQKASQIRASGAVLGRSCWPSSPVRSGLDPIPEEKRGQTIGVC
jgi:hypothetical protein